MGYAARANNNPDRNKLKVDHYNFHFQLKQMYTIPKYNQRKARKRRRQIG